MQIGRSDRGEHSRDSKVSVRENEESLEISEGEKRETERRFYEFEKRHREIEARVREEVERRYPELNEHQKFCIGYYAIADLHEGEYLDLCKELDIDDDYGSLAHAKHDYLSANDITFSPRDLEINPKTERSYAHEVRESVSEERTARVGEIEEFIKTNFA